MVSKLENTTAMQPVTTIEIKKGVSRSFTRDVTITQPRITGEGIERKRL